MDATEREILSLTDGKNFTMNRVLHISGFDEDSVTLVTQTGRVMLSGYDLKVLDFSKDQGTIEIEGELTEIVFDKKREKTKGKGLFSH